MTSVASRAREVTGKFPAKFVVLANQHAQRHVKKKGSHIPSPLAGESGDMCNHLLVRARTERLTTGGGAEMWDTM